MGRQRPREFQNLKPSAARLYFIFLSHFIMPLLRKKIWCDAGRVYGSTVFHATRRIPESERIWKDHFSSNRQPRREQIYIKVRIFLKDRARTLPSRYKRSTKTNTVDRHAPSLAVFGSFGSMLAWREGAMHQRSFNKIMLNYYWEYRTETNSHSQS